MKVVNTEAFLTSLTELLDEGREAAFPVSGTSMLPFLVPERDRVLLQKPDRALRVGDVALFRRENGRYILHRVCRISDRGCWFVGDAQKEIEGPVPAERICGIVVKACRKGEWIAPGNPVWDFFATLWARIPVLHPFLIQLYSKLK